MGACHALDARRVSAVGDDHAACAAVERESRYDGLYGAFTDPPSSVRDVLHLDPKYLVFLGGDHVSAMVTLSTDVLAAVSGALKDLLNKGLEPPPRERVSLFERVCRSEDRHAPRIGSRCCFL